MPKKALIYAWAIVAVGVTTAACAALTWSSRDAASMLVCLALAALASTFKIKLPGVTGTISPAFIFVLVAAGQFGFSETVAISAAAALVQLLWKPKARPSFLQAAFNAATITIAGGLAHGVAHGLLAGRNGIPAVVPLAVSGLVLLVTNTLPVAMILCLIRETPIYKVWRAIQLWAVPYYLAGGVLANVWAQAPLADGALVAVLAAISVYLLSLSYRGFVRLAGAHRTHESSGQPV